MLMQQNNGQHNFLPATENSDSELQCKITARDLLLDLKVLMKEYYVATFVDDTNSLKITFNNGQNFRLVLIQD